MAGHDARVLSSAAPAAARRTPRSPADPGASLRRAPWLPLAAMALAACTARGPAPPVPPARPDAAATAPVRAAAARAPAAAAARAPAIAAPANFPANALYVCVTGADGQRREAVIEFAPKVDELCRRHPEMGPCQYERDVCRSSGGRVFAAGGFEITRAVEAEYDRKVMRVRFKAN
jgi:hypothetical protein